MENKPLVVVVVDDEESVTRFMKRSLEERGWEVHTAGHGKEGIESALELKPDVIFVDVRMPVVQGYEMCRYIKKNPDTREAKVVVMSGLLSSSDKAWALNCGADDTLQKPFDGDEVVKKVEDLMLKAN
jgi:DNA-binding response OmpR family regulator